MTTETTNTATLEAPAAAPAKKTAKKAAPKKTAKKTVTKKAAKKAPKDKTSRSGQGNLPEDGLSAADRRISLVKLLRKMGATKASASVSLSVLSEKMGLSRKVVRGIICGRSGKVGSLPTCLMATGHVQLADVEEQGRSAYLTAKGSKTDFSDAPFVSRGQE